MNEKVKQKAFNKQVSIVTEMSFAWREKWNDRDSGGVDGEHGIEKHLPSLLESRAVIMDVCV